MAEYVAFNPDAEVIGQAILGVASALGEKAKPILKAHGLDAVTPDVWYRQQQWLDVLREVDNGDFYDLIAIGKQVAGHVPLPVQVDSVTSVLMLIGKTYSHNHRNCPGHTTPEIIGEKHIRLTVYDPYPNNMVYGVIYGFAARFEPHTIVRYDDDTPYGTDKDTVIYHVTW